MASALFPFLAGNGTSAPATQLPLFREYAWDGRGVILVNGRPKVLEGLPALELWIRKALITARYRYAAYSWNFGSELEDLTGENYTPAVTRVEAERLVKEALLVSPYIRSVAGLTTAFDGDTLEIRCTVDTEYGEVSVLV